MRDRVQNLGQLFPQLSFLLRKTCSLKHSAYDKSQSNRITTFLRLIENATYKIFHRNSTHVEKQKKKWNGLSKQPLVTAGQKKFHPNFGLFFLISPRLNHHHLKLHSKFMPEFLFLRRSSLVTHRKEL